MCVIIIISAILIRNIKNIIINIMIVTLFKNIIIIITTCVCVFE